MEETRVAYTALVWKPEGRRPLGRPRRRWEDNINMIFERLDGRAGTGSIWPRIGTGCEYGYERSSSIKCGEFLE
jgi:hypothetical protein